MENLMMQRQKQFRAAGMVMFGVAAGLLVSRILASLIYGFLNDTMVDFVFTFVMQVGFLLIAPFLIYKITLKKSFKGTMEFSNVRKPDLWIMLLCIPLGVCCLFVTMGVSTIWYALLTMLGFSSGGGSSYPETFSAGLLLLNILLTGVLPAICEEFANRGGFLTTMRGSFNEAQTIALCGLAFGLFHQNITQIFYTFLFGMLMAVLVIKTKSLFPAMLIHFINNSLSVYLDFASAYSLPLGGIINGINYLLLNHFLLSVVCWLGICAVGAALLIVILRLAKKDRGKRFTAAEGIKITAAEDEELDDAPVPLADNVLYKPVLRDWAFYIGALIMTAITTFCTFYWGLL